MNKKELLDFYKNYIDRAWYKKQEYLTQIENSRTMNELDISARINYELWDVRHSLYLQFYNELKKMEEE